MQQKKITITHVEEVPLKSSGDNSWIAGPDRYQNRPPVKRRRKLSPRFFVTIALMLLALGTGALIYTVSSRDAGASEDSSPSSGESGGPSGSSESAADPSAGETSAMVSDGSGENSETGSSMASSAEPESAFDHYAAPAGYDYGSPVPENTAQDTSWFEDAVFVGNSQTQGLLLYAGIPAASCADVGLTVETAATLQEFDDPDDPAAEEKLTALQYLEKADYKKVYLLFGINELGWQSETAFINQYTTLIQAIQSSHPDAQIYVQSILPVGEKASQDKSYLTNDRIAEFNVRLQDMAEELQVYYLDVASAFPTPLTDELSTDGIHLVREGCETWESYILSHCVYQSEGGGGEAGASSESQPPVSVTAAPTLPKNDG